MRCFWNDMKRFFPQTTPTFCHIFMQHINAMCIHCLWKRKVSEVVLVWRWNDVITGLCHSVSNSASRCLNWLMLCQLWNEVWLRFNMWLLLLLALCIVSSSRYETQVKIGRKRKGSHHRMLQVNCNVCICGSIVLSTNFSSTPSMWGYVGLSSTFCLLVRT